MKIDNVVMTGLYRCLKPSQYFNGPGSMYHCRNWTFKPHRFDGRLYFNDTYFGDKAIEITDANIDDFVLVFDFVEVRQITASQAFRFNESDRWEVPVDSGGTSHMKHFVLKDAMPDRQQILMKLQDDLDRAERTVESIKYDIQRVTDGSHWYLLNQ